MSETKDDRNFFPGDLRDYLAAHVQVPDDLGWCAAALMGEEPPKWTSSGDYENNLKCVRWWAEVNARYRYLEADAMLAARKEAPRE